MNHIKDQSCLLPAHPPGGPGSNINRVFHVTLEDAKAVAL